MRKYIHIYYHHSIKSYYIIDEGRSGVTETTISTVQLGMYMKIKNIINVDKKNNHVSQRFVLSNFTFQKEKKIARIDCCTYIQKHDENRMYAVFNLKA